MHMSNKTRRALKRATGTLGRKQLAEDVCQICAFIASSIIAHREQDFRLPDGTLVELGVNKRLEPPLGVRFPKSAAKREKCLACAGIGSSQCETCGGTGRAPIQTSVIETPCESCKGKGKISCEKCAGSGINWIRDDFAPTCFTCSQFVMVWLGEREKLAIIKQGSAVQKIILPTQQSRSLTKGIILPGR